MIKLEAETITLLDRIIEELDHTSELDNKVILEICNNDPKKAETICKVLEGEGWIKAHKVDQLNYPSKIERSDSFIVNLANGNYATRAEVEKENSLPFRIANNISAKNSNVVIGNNASLKTIKIKKNLAEKKSLFGLIFLIIGAVAGIFTILTYFK